MAHVPDGHPNRSLANSLEHVIRADFAFLQDPEIKSDATTLRKPFLETLYPHQDAELEARDAGLRHFDDRAADLEYIADRDFVVGQSLRREVFTELAGGREILSAEFGFPKSIILERIGIDRLVNPAMALQIGLAVAVEIERAQHDAFRNRMLEDAGGRGLVAAAAVDIGDLPGLAHIYR